MPELVEVEKLIRQLRPAFEGRAIVAVESLYRDKQDRPVLDHFLRKHHVQQFRERVLYQPLTSLDRIGKNLIFRYAHVRTTLQVHLNSTGWFLPGNDLAHATTTVNPSYKAFIATAISKEPLKYAMLGLGLDDGQVWYYCDPRTFGRWYPWTDKEVHENKQCDLLRYGPDWLKDPERATDTLCSWRMESPRKVKEVLLDQRITSGIGNYMVCEFLFRAGIHPDRPWNSLSYAEKADLALLAVDFMPYALSVTNHDHWLVFGKLNEPCKTPGCSGHIAYQKDNPNAIRGSYYCAACQPRERPLQRRVYTNIPAHPTFTPLGASDELRENRPSPRAFLLPPD